MKTIQTIGTAGHIDHGKTTLVQAMTGVDTDRLAEEKERGISIVLGFAHYTTPGGRDIGLVDVPGHERFIKNMVAGAWGVRGFMLTVAADEGVKPQTREHRDILELLGVTTGIVVLTKTDLVDDDRLQAVEAEVSAWIAGSVFEGCRIVHSSAKDPASVERVGAALDQLLDELPDPVTGGLFRLPVDRVFSLKGHGTVVTGTVASGKLMAGAPVEILPGRSRSRVRSLQAFDEPVEEVHAGQRAALNLSDLGADSVRRGDLCAVPGYFQPSQLLDCRLRLLRSLPKSCSPLQNRTRIRLYIGTREVTGRVHLLEGKQLPEGDEMLVQFRLEEPVSVARQDRFLLRLYSPVITLGGGQVLDPTPPKHRKAVAAVERLRHLETASHEDVVVEILRSGRRLFHTVPSLSVELSLPEDQIQTSFDADLEGAPLVRTGDCLVHRQRLESELQNLTKGLDAYHESKPTEKGMDRATFLRTRYRHLAPEEYDRLLALAAEAGDIEIDQNVIRRKGWKPSAGVRFEESAKRIEEKLAEAQDLFVDLKELSWGEQMMPHEFQQLIKFMVDTDVAVKVGPSFLIQKAFYDDLLRKALQVLEIRGRATTSELKGAVGLSRKYLIPFLEHLDGTGITARSDNERVLRKSD